MVNRFLEVMALALLVVLTIGTAFQMMNYAKLADIEEAVLKQGKELAAMKQPTQPQQVAMVPVYPQGFVPNPNAFAPQHSPYNNPNAFVQTPGGIASQTHAQQVPPTQGDAAPPTDPTTETQQPGTQPAASKPPVVVVKSDPETNSPKDSGEVIFELPKRNDDGKSENTTSSNDPPKVVPTAAEVKDLWAQHRPRVTKIVEDLYANRHAQVLRQSTSAFRTWVDEVYLADLMNSVRTKYGEYRKIVKGVLYDETTSATTFHVRVQSEQDKEFWMAISLAPNGQLSMLQTDLSADGDAIESP